MKKEASLEEKIDLIMKKAVELRDLIRETFDDLKDDMKVAIGYDLYILGFRAEGIVNRLYELRGGDVNEGE